MKNRVLLKTVLPVVLLILAAGPGLASGPQASEPSEATGMRTGLTGYGPWVIETVDTWGVGSHVSMAISAHTGITYISYYDYGNADLKMATYVGNGGNCGPTNNWKCETVDSGGDVGKYSSIAIDPTVSLPWIAYYDATNKALKLARWGGAAGWDIRTVHDPAVGSAGSYTSLKIDSDGWPHISYHGNIAPVGSNYWLFYATHASGSAGNCTNGDFQCDSIAKATFGGPTSLDMNDNGHIGIAYEDMGRLRYARRTSTFGGNCGPLNSGWNCSTDIDANHWYHSLDLDDASWHRPHIATWHDPYLYYSTPAGYGNGNCALDPITQTYTWQCDQIDTMGSGSHTRDVSMVLDNFGFPIIAYHYYRQAGQFVTWGLGVARPTAAFGVGNGNCGPQNSWHCERIPDNGDVGDYLAIAVKRSGLATVAYFDSEFPGALRVAYQPFYQIHLPLISKSFVAP